MIDKLDNSDLGSLSHKRPNTATLRGCVGPFVGFCKVAGESMGYISPREEKVLVVSLGDNINYIWRMKTP